MHICLLTELPPQDCARTIKLPKGHCRLCRQHLCGCTTLLSTFHPYQLPPAPHIPASLFPELMFCFCFVTHLVLPGASVQALDWIPTGALGGVVTSGYTTKDRDSHSSP